MTVKIRELQEKDLFNGFLESLDSLRKASDLTPKKAKTILTKIKSMPDHKIYVAVYDSKIIGAATIFIEPKFIHDGGKVGHIEDVVVSKKHQGEGTGQKLIKALISYAEKKGCYKTVLDCTDEIVPFYKKLGFKHFSNSMRFDHRSKK
ncbi:MAG: GNAT family N-acetyltransferase [Thaumarchaeota archaeon]|jgi:glucosamine-phosphate N-acetyltransferase|nr:GNAT family N-acetyltransferase [Nitrososphaerota archaeon]MBI3641023.1 GNAT family N-acetyltransferase [Nitrososphaerota archaeon]